VLRFNCFERTPARVRNWSEMRLESAQHAKSQAWAEIAVDIIGATTPRACQAEAQRQRGKPSGAHFQKVQTRYRFRQLAEVRGDPYPVIDNLVVHISIEVTQQSHSTLE